MDDLLELAERLERRATRLATSYGEELIHDSHALHVSSARTEAAELFTIAAALRSRAQGNG